MRTEIGVAMALIVSAAAVFSFSHRETPELGAAAPNAQMMQVNVLRNSKVGVLAAGELGHIQYSRDGGRVWAKARTEPNRHAQISDIAFYDGEMGVAVGHEGWVLTTADGGVSWDEVHFDKDPNAANALMGVQRLPSGMWLAVGSFGTTLRSMNDGITWQKFELIKSDDPFMPFDRHLNKVVHSPDRMTWMVLGETGTIIVSHDEGINWKQVKPFYNGSFYGGVALDDNTWIIYGMRGNVYRSEDRGETWQKSQVPLKISTFDHYMASPDLVYLVGQGGTIFRTTDRGRTFETVREGPQPALMDIEKDPSGTGWLMATEDGIRYYSEDFQDISQPFSAYAPAKLDGQSLPAQPGGLVPEEAENSEKTNDTDSTGSAGDNSASPAEAA